MGNRNKRKTLSGSMMWLTLSILFSFSLTPAVFAATPSSSPIQEDGVLIVGVHSEPKRLDPQKDTGIETVTWVKAVFDSLLTVDYNMKIVPLLAESLPTVSANGLTYTFKLRKDVKFHSGKPLTSEDVKFTFDRWLNKETASPTAPRMAAIDKVETPDPQTVVFRLKQPYNTFMTELSTGFASILNRDDVLAQGANWGVKSADGTGPFKFTNWVRNDHLTLTRFDGYRWGPAFYKNRGPAHLKEITIKFITEYNVRVMKLEAGELDLVLRMIPATDIPRLKKSGIDVLTVPILCTRLMAFRISTPGLDDVNVRRAIAHAINKKELVDNLYTGIASPADWPLEANTPGVKIDSKYVYSYDPEKAKKILEDAGWKVVNGIRQKGSVRLENLVFISRSQYRDELGLIQSQLAKINIGIKTQPLESLGFWPALTKNEHNLFHLNLPYESSDILYSYLHSKSRPTPNAHDFADPKVDQLLMTYRNAPTQQESLAATAEVQRIMMDQALWVPLYYPLGTHALNPKVVHDFNPHSDYDTGSHKLLDIWTTRK
jgi:peptide/nickel transport system substrate-binding protein